MNENIILTSARKKVIVRNLSPSQLLLLDAMQVTKYLLPLPAAHRSPTISAPLPRHSRDCITTGPKSWRGGRHVLHHTGSVRVCPCPRPGCCLLTTTNSLLLLEEMPLLAGSQWTQTTAQQSSYIAEKKQSTAGTCVGAPCSPLLSSQSGKSHYRRESKKSNTHAG